MSRREVIKASGQKAKMKWWEFCREEWERGVSLTGGWMEEEATERKREVKSGTRWKLWKHKSREMSYSKPPTTHVFFFSLWLCSTYLQSRIKDDWLTTTNLFDPDGCEAGSAGEDAYNSEIKWGHGCRCMVNWVSKSHSSKSAALTSVTHDQ